jgi:demethylmenaquinone methyltransferase/2-methoxy-6-polyprenyl-1,4-benzoquinol methylase
MPKTIDVEPKLRGDSAVDPRDGARGPKVRAMFAEIAGRYDVINRVLSGGRDLSWRRVAVKMAALRGGERVLDVCCGTGDFALMFAAHRSSPASVTGLDFTPEMLRIAKDRAARMGAPIEWLAGDALHLPFPDASFDVASVGYGVRNFQELDAGLRELARVLRPGGRAVILDCTPARGLIGKAANFYINRIMPWAGNRLSGSKDRAYSYLADSIMVFPDCAELQRRMEGAGFNDVKWRKLNFGTMAVHVGQRDV